MTGADHYRKAEALIAEANRIMDGFPGDQYAQTIATAQVHATLAVAAATALGHEGADGTMPSRDRAQWFDAAAAPAPKLSEARQS